MSIPSKYSAEVDFASDISIQAAQILKDMQQHAIVAVQKDIGDISTTADLAAEKCILDAITLHYPMDGIHAEEAGDSNTQSTRRWVVDPLDGTKEYAKGLAEFNVLIGLEENTIPVMGVIRRIGPDEVLTSTIDGPATYNGNTITVSKTKELEKSFVGFHLPSKSNGEKSVTYAASLLRELDLLCYRIRPGWDTAQQCSWVARGILDAHIISPCVNKWHDVMEGLLLVERAGGKVTDFNGKPIISGNMNNGFVITNGYLHEELCTIVSKQFPI